MQCLNIIKEYFKNNKLQSIIVIRNNGKEALLMNHGAEHKVFNAYNKLKRIPTIDEAKKFSRITGKCGVSIYSGFVTCQLIGYFAFRVGIGNLWMLEFILFVAALIFSDKFPLNILGKFAQLFTTSKPNYKNIELGIAALSAIEEKENNSMKFNIQNEDFDKLMH